MIYFISVSFISFIIAIFFSGFVIGINIEKRRAKKKKENKAYKKKFKEAQAEGRIGNLYGTSYIIPKMPTIQKIDDSN